MPTPNVSGKHAFKLEQRIREKLVAGESACLPKSGTRRPRNSARKNLLVSDSLTRLKELITQDGALLDCNGALPGQLIGHAWKLSQQRRAERFNEEVERLILKLGNHRGRLRHFKRQSQRGKPARCLRHRATGELRF